MMMQHTKHARSSLLTAILFLLLIAVTISAMVLTSGCSDGAAIGADDGETEPANANQGSALRAEDIYTGDLVLINSAYPCAFRDGCEFASVFDYKSSSYNVRDKDVMLNGSAIYALNLLLDEFNAVTGLSTVNVVSGYRSYEFQQQLYTDSVARDGEAHARRYVASAGHSEHHSGLAADLALFFSEDGSSAEFDGEGEYAWIIENAPRYGLIRRYSESKSELTGVASEPWHLRYVGLPHSMIMDDEDMCLEEYIDYLRDYSYDSRLEYEYEGTEYEIYFAEGTDVKIPDGADFTLSGNNVDGFIVTLKK